MRGSGIRHRFLGERQPALETFGLRLGGLDLHTHSVKLFGLGCETGVEFA